MGKKRKGRITKTTLALAESSLGKADSAETLAQTMMDLATSVFVRMKEIPCVFTVVSKTGLVMLTSAFTDDDEKLEMWNACRSLARKPGVRGTGLAMEATMTPTHPDDTAGPFGTPGPVDTIVTSGEWHGQDVHIKAVEVVYGDPPKIIQHKNWSGSVKQNSDSEGLPVSGMAFDFMGQHK